MPTYTVALVGCGARGAMHARGVLASPDRFRLVAACDVDAARLGALAAELAIPRTYSDAGAMLAAERPDVLCVATPPRVRLPLVELGVAHGVKAIAMEKPMALGLAEGRRILELCGAAGVRTVVCHQLRHGAHWQRARDLVGSGEIGDVEALHATGRPSMLRVGTHLVDHMLWLNGGHPALWVIGQAHGVGGFREDHPCPDYVAGLIEFANGARGILECGPLAPRRSAADDFWGDGAVTVYGTHGYVRAVIGAGWQALTRSSGGTVLSGPPDPSPQEAPHLRALADWLDDPRRVHPCHGEWSYHGLEILLGIALSSLERRRVAVPIAPLPAEPVLARLEQGLPDADGA